MKINDEIRPAMVTPFTEKDRIDTDCISKLAEWYTGKGVDGLFAVCQGTAEIAAKFAEVFCSESWGFAAGMMHDTGKAPEK
jgi:hypothetical protein